MIDTAMKAAMDICHDLNEGYIPGCGKCLSLVDMQDARETIAAIIRSAIETWPVQVPDDRT